MSIGDAVALNLKTVRRNSVIALGVAIVFCWFFMFAKHAPGLRDAIPFGDDPVDAVGSDAVMVGILIAVLAVVRAFTGYLTPPGAARYTYVVRTQQAVILIVLCAVAADVVAMARHPQVWIRSPSGELLVALVAGMAVVAAIAYRFIATSYSCAPSRKALAGAIAASITAAFVLAFYPQQLIVPIGTHLLTIIFAGVLLFATVWLLLEACVPLRVTDSRSGSEIYNGFGRWRRMGFVMIIGLVVGAAAFAGEMSEGAGTLVFQRLIFVAAVFVGLGAASVFIAYAFLAGPLGLDSAV